MFLVHPTVTYPRPSTRSLSPILHFVAPCTLGVFVGSAKVAAMSFTTIAPIGPEILAPAAAVTALASHWLYFNRGEHHMRAPLYFWLCVTSTFVLLAYELLVCHRTYVGATKVTALTVGSYAITIFTSITIYRTCFHALLVFPGPRLAGVSKFWHVYHTLNSQNHLLMERLHEKYGSFVRTGEL